MQILAAVGLWANHTSILSTFNSNLNWHMFKKLITFKIIKYWFDMLVVYLNTHENKYVASSFSFFLSCHYNHICICMCIYVLIYNLLSPYTHGSFQGWPFDTGQRTIVFFRGEDHPSLSQLCSVAWSSLSRLRLHGLFIAVLIVQLRLGLCCWDFMVSGRHHLTAKTLTSGETSGFVWSYYGKS